MRIFLFITIIIICTILSFTVNQLHSINLIAKEGRQIQRQKKGLTDLLLYPGTKWCGMGSRAHNYGDIGGYSDVDRCCRVHDTECPMFIDPLSKFQDFFNWRPYTINHCTCDERFYSCLKSSDSHESKWIGNVFFNLIQMKCFILKSKPTCVAKTWWGKCQKYEMKKIVELHEVQKF